MTTQRSQAEESTRWVGGELVDVVDEADRVVRTVTRSEMRRDVLRHRATYVFVLSTDGLRVLAHQRSAAKDLWPSRWDLAVGGVVSAGETYDASAARELAEEVGVSAALERLGPLRFDCADGHVNGMVYVAQHEGPFTFTDGEVARVEWLGLDSIDKVLPQRTWCDDTIGAALPLLRTHLRSI
jgi:8-oxo-dGTP pyrophosphatase MutT (NUDIX family)